MVLLSCGEEWEGPYFPWKCCVDLAGPARGHSVVGATGQPLGAVSSEPSPPPVFNDPSLEGTCVILTFGKKSKVQTQVNVLLRTGLGEPWGSSGRQCPRGAGVRRDSRGGGGHLTSAPQ